MQPSLDAPGDAVGQPGRRAGGGHLVEGRVPRIGGGIFFGLKRRPQLDQAGLAVPRRKMADLSLAGGHAVAGLRRLEHSVDEIKHRPSGTVGKRQIDRPPLAAGIPDPIGEMGAHTVEFVRIGALEAENGLLFVADGKDRAWTFPASLAGEKLPGDGGDDLPLFGAGILGFVDKYVIDAAVELVMHPGGAALGGEEIPGLGDQVVVI